MIGRIAIALGGVCAVLVVMQLGFRLFSASPEPASSSAPEVAEPVASAPPEVAPAAKVEATVRGVDGVAEYYAVEVGVWRPLTPGIKLTDSAVLRTRQGEVRLELDGHTQVVMNPSSQFRLGELTDSLSKVSLEGGRVTATVREGAERELVVQVEGSDATASSRNGEFSVLRGPSAQVTLASTAGVASLTSGGKSVTLRAGEQSSAASGQAPTAVQQIPKSLFLKVAQAQGEKLRQRLTTVTGVTTPGAVVNVNGTEAATSDGVFSVRVALNEGDNAINVQVTDVLGRTRSQRLTGLRVDSQPPAVKGHVEW